MLASMRPLIPSPRQQNPRRHAAHPDPNWPEGQPSVETDVRPVCPAPKRWRSRDVTAAPTAPFAEAFRMRAPQGDFVRSATPKRRAAAKLPGAERRHQPPKRPPSESVARRSARRPFSARSSSQSEPTPKRESRDRRRVPLHRVDFRGLSKAQSPYPTCAVLPALADRASHGLVPLQGVPSADSMVGFFPPPRAASPLRDGPRQVRLVPRSPRRPKAPAVSRLAPHTIYSRGLSHTAARGHPCTGSPEC